jgi:hypothetical protein
MIAYYISGHGFGHAARQQAIIQQLSQQSVPVMVRTGAPPKFFDFPHVTYHHAHYDVGMVQSNSFDMDYYATVQQLQQLVANEPAIIAHEVEVLCQAGVRLIVSDMPSLASDIGLALGVPVYFITHFTWDWVYSAYVDIYPAFAPFIEHITAQLNRATGLLKLPFYHPMPQFAHIEVMPLVANTPTRRADAVRADLGVQADEKVALLSMGGLGWSEGDVGALADVQGWRFWMMPGAYEQVAHLPQCTLIPTDYPAYHDLIASADVVVGKAGWSTVAEVIAHNTAMIVTFRPDWYENTMLGGALSRHARHLKVAPDDFQRGAWVDLLDTVLTLPDNRQPIAQDGAQVIANRLRSLMAPTLA